MFDYTDVIIEQIEKRLDLSTCKVCHCKTNEIDIVEKTSEGYVWESKCLNPKCGAEDTGYEF